MENICYVLKPVYRQEPYRSYISLSRLFRQVIQQLLQYFMPQCHVVIHINIICYCIFLAGLTTSIMSSASPTTAERSSRSASPKAQTTVFPTTNRITTSTEPVYNPTKPTPMTMTTGVTVQVLQTATATLSADNDSMVTEVPTVSSTRNQVLTRSTVGEHLHVVHYQKCMSSNITLL